MRLSAIFSLIVLSGAFASPVANDLKKRIDATRITWYDVSVGTTACGGTYSNSDSVVAMNSEQFGSGSACGKTISITSGGKTVSAQVVDLCPGCPSGGLDLTSGLFSQFGSTDIGVLTGTWEFT